MSTATIISTLLLAMILGGVESFTVVGPSTTQRIASLMYENIRSSSSTRASFVPLGMMSSDDAEKRQSRIEGNQRAPTPQELSIMDEMIDKLKGAQPWELPNAVRQAFRVCSSPQFFMRIAERTDLPSTSEKEREQLSSLASNLVATLEAVVSTTEETLEDRAVVVETVVKAASEPGTGEFLVPLTQDRIDAMREELIKVNPRDLDEGFLTTIDSWTNKSRLDGMDGMVGILQKLLQMYAGLAVSRARQQQGSSSEGGDDDASPAATALETLLATDAEQWDVTIRTQCSGEEAVTKQDLVTEIQKTMESVVLGLENGSMAQRIQAEYLKELLTRVESS